MARAITHGLGTSLAFEASVDGTKKGIVEATITWLRASFIHCLRIQNVANAHVFDLLGRHETELDLFDRLERCARERGVIIRHVSVRQELVLE